MSIQELILNENDFANSELTGAKFYLLDNKIICQNEYGTYSYYDCESPEFFLYGEVLESDYNLNYGDLTDNEKAQISELERLNNLVNKYNLSVVCLSPNNDQDVVLIHNLNPENYFLINFELLEQDIFNKQDLDFLLSCKLRKIKNPRKIYFENNKIFCKKTKV